MKPGHDDWTPPDEFDEYKLVRQLGRGTMGQVYLAHDRLLDRLVAIKFITALESSARERFLVEARAAARIQHPNVVAVHRVGELKSRPYLISEYVRGQSLAELKLPLPWARALELGAGLARGLAAAHRQGVLHRDIKLANAMLSEAGEVKLLDFSLAKLVDVPSLGRLRGNTIPPGGSRALESMAEAATPLVDGAAAKTMTLAAPDGAQPGASSTTARELDWRAGGLEITAVGALVGTPHYMAPELWRGEPASRVSDVYALGVLLYCLCCGQPPTEATTLLELAERVQEVEARPLLERAPEVDPRLAAIIDRCLARDPAARFATADALREALEAIQPAGPRWPAPGGNPYRGLQAFDAAHRELFFGRNAEIQAVLGRLRAHNFVLVAGDSGVGKSSLCRAGVIPAVLDGGLEDGQRWVAVTLTPGRRPVQALLSALARTREADEALLQSAVTEPGGLARALGAGKSTNGCLLFVDQLEELITLAPPAEGEAAARILGAVARGIAGVRLIATVRADFLTRVAPLPEFGEEMVRGLFFLYPLSAANVRRAIVGPAQARSVRFESDALVDKLVTAGVEGSLPLLQFALAELWEARSPNSNVITAAALDKIGGVSGALARHAEGVLARLSPRQRRAARSLLLRLVTIEETRASMTPEELRADGDDARVALDALIAARLILIRDVAEGPPVYEIAHEALIRGWVSLQVWLDEEKESRLVRHRLEHAAAEWDRLGHPRDGLWSGRQLKESERLDRASLRKRELEFLRASAARLTRIKRTKAALWIGAPLLVALSAGAAYLIQRAAVQRKIDGHLEASRSLVEDARALGADVEQRRRAAFAAFDAGDEAGGEAAWRQAIRGAPGVQRLYARAAGRLETALGLDAGRADVRGALADVLYEQALLAERDHDLEQTEALMLRVELHDPDGERMARWQAPARVEVRSEPAGATLTAARYERDAEGRLRLVEEQVVGPTPARFEARPGSYLWTLAAEGRAPVRYPVLLRRGEDFSRAIALPPIEQAPPGFAYVPAGRFLYGSADDEDLRSGFFTAPPMHEVETGAYWIARHETTYAEWIGFLQALDPAERARRTGASEGVSASASILRLDADGAWQLELRRGDRTLVARAGELLRYPGRGDRGAQDWLKMPVTGITWDDARVYIEWLARTGRVPGARFCTEVEWERAARGADGRRFPTGDDIRPDEANYDATYRHDPAAMGADVVGSYPASSSPFGVEDATGNVWEWTLPAGEPPLKVARGGSYFFAQVAGRLVNRTLLDASYRDSTLGLRVCATPQGGSVPDK